VSLAFVKEVTFCYISVKRLYLNVPWKKVLRLSQKLVLDPAQFSFGAHVFTGIPTALIAANLCLIAEEADQSVVESFEAPKRLSLDLTCCGQLVEDKSSCPQQDLFPCFGSRGKAEAGPKQEKYPASPSLLRVLLSYLVLRLLP